MKSLELLNKVQRILVDFANNEGINLQDQFGTVDEFKKFVIGFTFKALTDMGIEVNAAYDMVLGEGQYDSLVDQLWNAAQ